MVQNEEEGANRDTAKRKKKRKKLGWRTAARKKWRTAANWSEIKRREPIGVQR
jgi:hypothetical protein